MTKAAEDTVSLDGTQIVIGSFALAGLVLTAIYVRKPPMLLVQPLSTIALPPLLLLMTLAPRREPQGWPKDPSLPTGMRNVHGLDLMALSIILATATAMISQSKMA